MDLSSFFEPVGVEPDWINGLRRNQIGKKADVFLADFPNWEGSDIVLIGCRENRGGGEGNRLDLAPDMIRRQFYTLFMQRHDVKITDLGNLRGTETQDEAYQQLAEVMKPLFENGKVVVLLGGSQDITYGQYLAYENPSKKVHYVHVDSRLDIQDFFVEMGHASFNQRIFLHRPDFLESYTNLGYQRFLVSEEEVNAIQDLNFFKVRYGELIEDLREAEPYFRMADMVSFDMSAIQHAHVPGANMPSPGGFNPIEASRLARYAGLGYHCQSFSVSEIDPKQDLHDQSSMMAAILVWYFIEGVYARKSDEPLSDLSNLTKYTVKLQATVSEINFYRHPTTARWWMAVPRQSAIASGNLLDSVLVACSEKDYETARSGHLPDRWWVTFNRLRE